MANYFWIKEEYVAELGESVGGSSGTAGPVVGVSETAESVVGVSGTAEPVVGSTGTLGLGKTIAAVITVNRKRLGLSQEELAGRCGVTREYISMIENGKRTPQSKTLERLAGCFGKKVPDLVDERDDAKEKLELVLRLHRIAESGDTEQLKKLVEFAQELSEVEEQVI